MGRVAAIDRKVRLATGGRMLKGKLVGGYRLPSEVKGDLRKGNIRLVSARTGSGFAIKPTAKGKKVFSARVRKMRRS